MPTVVQLVQGEQLEPVENSLSIHCPAARRANFSYDCVATAAASPASLGCATTEKAKAKRIVTLQHAIQVRIHAYPVQGGQASVPLSQSCGCDGTRNRLVQNLWRDIVSAHRPVFGRSLRTAAEQIKLKYLKFGGVFGSWLIFECTSSGRGLLATMPVRGLLANIRLSHRLGSFD